MPWSVEAGVDGELSRRSELSVPTIKYYLRRLAAAGASDQRNQAVYDQTYPSGCASSVR